MEVQDARRVREAFEDMVAVVDRADLNMTYEELVGVAEELEVVGRTLTAITTARPAQATAAGDPARSHRIGRDAL